MPLGESSSHLISVFFGVPADLVWPWLSNPLQFPRLYPSWVKRVEWLGPAFYVAVGTTGSRFVLRPRLCQETGVIDIEIVTPGAKVEVTRGRLFPVSGGCLFVHVASRWEGEDEASWAIRRRAVEGDLARAARELERELTAVAA